MTKNNQNPNYWQGKSYSSEYTKYLQSHGWRLKRKVLLEKVGYRCERCGRKHKKLEVHHLTYQNLGNEPDTDLKVVCPNCHRVEDRLRERQTHDQQSGESRSEAYRRQRRGRLEKILKEIDADTRQVLTYWIYNEILQRREEDA